MPLPLHQRPGDAWGAVGLVSGGQAACKVEVIKSHPDPKPDCTGT